jgi:hypothetical protein
MRVYLEGRRVSGDSRYRDATPLAGCLGQQVVCLTTIGESTSLRALQAELVETYGAQLSFHFFGDTYTRWYWLTTHDPRATKDQAIATLKEYAGLRDARVTAFGDGLNDIRMFAAADKSIAVANAEEELKRHAHLVIGSNEEDSVVRYLTTQWQRPRTAG